MSDWTTTEVIGPLTLTEQEIQALTRKVRPSAQIRALREAGIPHKVVAGWPVVARQALVDTLLNGRHTTGPQLRNPYANRPERKPAAA